MWSSRAGFSVPRLIALFACAALGGCFQPLYGGASGTALVADLAAINVVPAPERVGYYLTKELTFALHGGADVPPPKYNLAVSVHERVTTPLIDTVSGRATAAILGVDIEYQLTDRGTGKVVTAGAAFTTETYDRSSQRFANIRAARDAEIRAAQVLADQIKTRLAASLRAGA